MDTKRKLIIVPGQPEIDAEPVIPEAEAAGIVAPPPESRRVMSIADLCHECNTQSGKMSVTNPNKQLLLNCAYAMQQLVDRLEFHESKVVKQ